LVLNAVKPNIIRPHATKLLRRKRRGIKPEEINHNVQQVEVPRFSPLAHKWARGLLNFVAIQVK